MNKIFLLGMLFSISAVYGMDVLQNKEKKAEDITLEVNSIAWKNSIKDLEKQEKFCKKAFIEMQKNCPYDIFRFFHEHAQLSANNLYLQYAKKILSLVISIKTAMLFPRRLEGIPISDQQIQEYYQREYKPKRKNPSAINGFFQRD